MLHHLVKVLKIYSVEYFGENMEILNLIATNDVLMLVFHLRFHNIFAYM